MDEHVIVWDLETIPDLAAVARAHDLEEHNIAAARAVLGEKFPKHPWHQIVCIGALIAARSPEGWQVLSLGAPHVGARTEAELITAFVGKIAELEPRLVTFNGNAFDLPVLRYRAMLHGIAAPGLSCRSYFHRFTDDAVDLCDVLSSFGNAKATLHQISRTLNLPGKASGIEGSQVEQLVQEGRIVEVAAYCLEDVTNTYRIWLRHSANALRKDRTREYRHASSGHGKGFDRKLLRPVKGRVSDDPVYMLNSSLVEEVARRAVSILVDVRGMDGAKVLCQNLGHMAYAAGGLPAALLAQVRTVDDMLKERTRGPWRGGEIIKAVLRFMALSHHSVGGILTSHFWGSRWSLDHGS